MLFGNFKRFIDFTNIVFLRICFIVLYRKVYRNISDQKFIPSKVFVTLYFNRVICESSEKSNLSITDRIY